MEDLAGMVQRGFGSMDDKFHKIDECFDGIGERFNEVENNLRIFSENNTREHEDIKLRLGNVAHRFELVELEKRVDVLEKKTGVKNK